MLVLSPIYAATSVSEEKTRRTLPYLLASRLRDDEIVLGKIALAVLRVWEVLLCGLPLCAMCLLLGGVTPEFMALDFLLAMAAAWASCALAVLVAILSRRLSEALLLVLLLQLSWYILPVLDSVARAAATGFYIPHEILQMNAFTAIYRGQLAGTVDRWEVYAASLAATLACGLIASLAAWWLLRPAWRREEQRGSPRSLFARLRLRGRLKACGTSPGCGASCAPGAADRSSGSSGRCAWLSLSECSRASPCTGRPASPRWRPRLGSSLRQLPF